MKLQDAIHIAPKYAADATLPADVRDTIAALYLAARGKEHSKKPMTDAFKVASLFLPKKPASEPREFLRYIYAPDTNTLIASNGHILTSITTDTPHTPGFYDKYGALVDGCDLKYPSYSKVFPIFAQYQPDKIADLTVSNDILDSSPPTRYLRLSNSAGVKISVVADYYKIIERLKFDHLTIAPGVGIQAQRDNITAIIMELRA